jgi:hemerythrin-like metal-binding protein
MDINALWKPEYSVGNEKIDGQHKYLFELWIMLNSIKDQSSNRRSLEQALLSLLDYVVIHFADEEKILAGHPDIASHKQLHAEFLRQSKSFMLKFQNNSLDIHEVIDFLRNWLIDHIVKTDIRYFKEMT